MFVSKPLTRIKNHTREFTKPSPNRSAKLSLLLCQRAVMSWLRNFGSLTFSLVDLIGLNWLVGHSVSVGFSVLVG